MNKSIFKIVGSSLLVLMVIGFGLSLVSNTTVERSNDQMLKELAQELNAVSTELAELREANQNLDLTNPTIGEVTLFAGNFAPRGWAFCDGQLLPISQYQALFSILGTIYGGDGRSTFALPDLRGRVPVHKGSGPGMETIALGQKFGSEETTLTALNLPPHSHRIVADLPSHNFEESNEDLYPGGTALLGVANPINGHVHEEFNTQTDGGNGRGFSTHQPSMGMNYIIALQGTFPSRN